MRDAKPSLADLVGYLTASTVLPAFPVKTPSEVVAPIIRASPSLVSIPAGQTEGTTTLSWDGGREHPYAEVLLKIDAQGEKFVVESGKGRRQVKIELGKTYLYILTDSGQRLATVVTAKASQ